LDDERKQLAKKLNALMKDEVMDSGKSWLEARMETEYSKEFKELAILQKQIKSYQEQLERVETERLLASNSFSDDLGSFEHNTKKLMQELGIAENLYPDFKDIYRRMIKEKVRRFWQQPNDSSANDGLRIQISLAPNGEISEPTIVRSSGSRQFDQSVLTAVEQTGGLAIPSNVRLYNSNEIISFNFPGPG
jgi:TonB family protein